MAPALSSSPLVATATGVTSVTTATDVTTANGVTSSPTDVTAIITGFGMVGDNVDQNVRPSFQRGDMQTESWHCFHSYAVVDRVDISHLSDEPSATVVSPDSVLPNSSDLVKLYGEFEVFILRYIHYCCNCGDTSVIVFAELLCNTLTDLKNKLPVYNGILNHSTRKRWPVNQKWYEFIIYFLVHALFLISSCRYHWEYSFTMKQRSQRCVKS